MFGADDTNVFDSYVNKLIMKRTDMYMQDKYKLFLHYLRTQGSKFGGSGSENYKEVIQRLVQTEKVPVTSREMAEYKQKILEERQVKITKKKLEIE